MANAKTPQISIDPAQTIVKTSACVSPAPYNLSPMMGRAFSPVPGRAFLSPVPVDRTDAESTNSEIMTRIRLKWHTSRGMPPIFGFLGKVSAKGKKALINSIVLLILNIFFITGSAFALSAIENNETLRSRANKDSFETQLDLKWFLGMPHEPKTNDSFPNHHPQHQGWGEAEWDRLKMYHDTRCFKLDNAHTQQHLWNFWSSFDFCATVLTTIGYGSMYPRTQIGKWFCLIYSIIGIPVMAMYLALFSKGICTVITSLIGAISTVLYNMDRSFRLNDLVSRIFSLVILLGALAVFVCMWSGILTSTNKSDSFMKCMYFYVITLTTVGLGDISMTEARPFVLIRVLFLFCVGLTLVTSVFNALRSVSAAHTKMLKAHGQKLATRAQETVKESAQKLMRSNNNDSQLVPLTKDTNNYSSENIETTFTIPEGEAVNGNAGFNSAGYTANFGPCPSYSSLKE